MTLLERLRMRAAAMVAGLILAAVALLTWTAAGPIAVIASTITLATIAVAKIGARFDAPVCRGCGEDLSGLQAGAYGVACPTCGVLNLHGAGDPGLLPESIDTDDDEHPARLA